MIVKIVTLLTLAVCFLAVACGDDDEVVATQTPGETPTPRLTQPSTATPDQTPATPDPGDASAAAIEALGTWLGPVGDPSAITVDSVEKVIWPNGCLGLSRAGVACTEGLVDGFRIDLGLGDAAYEVRTDVGGNVVMWAPGVQLLAFFKEASTNSVQFTTDDGGLIEAQPVAGTSYGVDLESLVEGNVVGVAIADAPQGGGALLVWVDLAGIR